MKKALISLSDRSNLEYLAKELKKLNFEIIATGSTAVAIKKFGVECKTVKDITGFEEILGGRVKTLNPKIHGGILADFTNKNHLEELKKHDIDKIDLVVCNLYPFEEILNENNNSHEKLIENIDIGGVTLIRAASKNHKNVSLVCDINDYEKIINELKNFGEIKKETKLALATKGFIHTATYDIIIANYFQHITGAKEALLCKGKLKSELRYGENPHQKAYYFKDGNTSYSVESSEILWGKALSYNNILDIEANLMILKDFKQPTAVAIKHNTPCGIGMDEKSINKAFEKCFNVDTVSIFGGIVSVNREIDINLANKLNEIFLEIVMAPSYTEDALKILKSKKNLRIMKIKTNDIVNKIEVKKIQDGYLVQQLDNIDPFKEEIKVVTNHKIEENELYTLKFLQKVCKYAKSNAIVIGQEGLVLGIGSGEVNRIDACKLALERAKNNLMYDENKPLYLASDAFFPFPDIIKYTKSHNLKYIIQPGGSIRDDKVIEEANKNNIKMVFTGVRHFKH